MLNLVDKLKQAQSFAFTNRPKVGGFPYLAEVLRQAGVKRNLWYLPSCQSIYIMEGGNLVQQMPPLFEGLHPVPQFDQQRLITALRQDQAGKTSFVEFLQATWEAGVVSYEADFLARKVVYFSLLEERYEEKYPAVTL